MLEELPQRILTETADPVVRFRLLRDVLHRPPGSPEMVAACDELSGSRWVRELEREQRDDCGWGDDRVNADHHCCHLPASPPVHASTCATLSTIGFHDEGIA